MVAAAVVAVVVVVVEVVVVVMMVNQWQFSMTNPGQRETRSLCVRTKVSCFVVW